MESVLHLAGEGSAAYQTGYALGPVCFAGSIILLCWLAWRFLRRGR